MSREQVEGKHLECLPDQYGNEKELCCFCGTGGHSSASTSSHGHDLPDLPNCQRSRDHSTAYVAVPKPVSELKLRSCKLEGCNKLIVSTNTDHETLCGYRIIYCRSVGCSRPVHFKDLLLHLENDHSLLKANKLGLKWPTLEFERYHAIPLYAFDTILWQFVYFKRTHLIISLYHESPNRLTPKLLAVISLRCCNVEFSDTVRVVNFGNELQNEQFILPYSKIKLYKDMKLAHRCLGSHERLEVIQSLEIIKDTF